MPTEEQINPSQTPASTDLLKIQNSPLPTFHIGGLPAGQVGKLKVLMWLDRWIIKDTASREINEAYINIKHRPTVSADTSIIAYIT